MSKQQQPGSDDVFGEVISSYSRAQAIEDGVLADVTETAREAGFTCSVALTSKLWHAVSSVPLSGPGACGDAIGRLWDVVHMARLAARRGGESIEFLVILPFQGSRKRNQALRMVAGPGDAGELVITIGFREDAW